MAGYKKYLYPQDNLLLPHILRAGLDTLSGIYLRLRHTGRYGVSLTAKSAWFHEQFRLLSLLSRLWFWKARKIAMTVDL